MEPQIQFNLEEIKNVKKTIVDQINKFNDIRKLIKNLNFIPVDPVGTYTPVSYKSIDGGRMGIYFDPFEFDFIVIADSFGNELLNFLVPKLESFEVNDYLYLDKIEPIKNLLKVLEVDSITNISNLLKSSETVMELSEYACIFERLTKEKNEPLLLMMDGLLRTILIKPKYINKLLSILKDYKKQRLIGVAKSSRVLNLISSALFIEKKIPHGYTGYIEIPWEIEKLAYKWKGRGIQDDKKSTYLFHSFGKLYVAKLSKNSNLLVTVEIPYDFDNNEEIYSKMEINEIMGHLVKDSQGSYPILGYPQTIMRAHEKAVRCGFTASIWRDKIIDKLLDEIGDERIRKLIIESNFLREYVNKGLLGGF
jgi:hypothetical protein